MSEIKLLPCPFCGGKAYLKKNHRAFINAQSTRVTFVRCEKCNARTGRFELRDFGTSSHCKEAEQKAIKAWNTRKPMGEIIAKLDELQDYHTYTEVDLNLGYFNAYEDAIAIVKEVGGVR